MPQTDTANVIPELAGGWNDGLACFIFRFLKRPLEARIEERALVGPHSASQLIAACDQVSILLFDNSSRSTSGL